MLSDNPSGAKTDFVSGRGAIPNFGAVKSNFLGQTPPWYKATIVLFLLLNPVILFAAGPFAAGWALMLEFIFTLAMALKCYPLQPGGLLAMEAVLMGLTSPTRVYEETAHNFPVLLLLIFMVAGIYFMKELLLHIFSNLIIRVQNKTLLSLTFCWAGAALSAFLDALTVMAVMMTVAEGFFGGLSMVSDNVFVATVYMTEAQKAFEAAMVTREQYDLIAVAINVGTNIPSVATPNGQAAFLFLLTSSLATAIRLSYVRMLTLAAPYTVVLTATGFTMIALAF